MKKFIMGSTAVVLFAMCSMVALAAPKTSTKKAASSVSGLSAGMQVMMDTAEDVDAADEMGEVINEGVVQNNLPGYDWNTMVMANVESVVNIRSEASEDSEIVGKLYKDAYGTIVETTDGWTKITSGNATGWVKDDYLLFGTDAEALAETAGSWSATTTTGGLRIRKQPKEDAGVYDLAEAGKTYEVKEQTEGWVGIAYGDNVGYISSDYVTLSYKLGTAKTTAEIKAEEEAKAAAEKKAAEEAAAKKKAEAAKKTAAAAKNANPSDVAILAAIVQLEAGSESYEGQLAVASCIMNRVRSAGYPNTVSGVVYQSGQFPPANSSVMASLVSNGASAGCTSAARQAIAGVSNIGNLTHFRAASLGGDIVIGGHAFY